jgi:hypothetical protein
MAQQHTSSWFSADNDRLVAQRARATRTPKGWVLVFGAGMMLAVTAFDWLLGGRFFEETVIAVTGFKWDELAAVGPTTARITSLSVRFAGAAGLCAGVLAMAMAMTSFRRGDRWAWYAAWALPLFAGLELIVLAAYGAVSGSSLLWDGTLAALGLLGLAVSYPAFFTSARAA